MRACFFTRSSEEHHLGCLNIQDFLNGLAVRFARRATESRPSGHDGVGVFDRRPRQGVADGTVETLAEHRLGLVLGALGAPVELGDRPEDTQQVVVAEVVADRQLEGVAADHQLEDGVDPTCSRQSVSRALPGVGPGVGCGTHHVLAHLELLLLGELREGGTTRHQRREGQVETLDVDASGTVTTLVGPLVRLAHDDHVLERAAGIRGQLLAQAVGAALSLRLPVANLVLHLELEPCVDATALVLLQEELDPRGVVHPLGHSDDVLPAEPLVGVEDLERTTAMLAIVEDDVGTALVAELAVHERPASLESPDRVLGEGDVRFEHGLGDGDRVGIRVAAVDAELGLAEALDTAELHELLCREGEREELDALLVRHEDGSDHAGLLGGRRRDEVGYGRVVG